MTSPREINCPSCGSSQTVPLEKIPEEGAWGRCAVCKHRIFIERPAIPSSSDSPQLSDDTWAPAPAVPRPTVEAKVEPRVEETKVGALFVKTPDGRTNRLDIKEVRDQVRLQRILPWDLVSEDGGRFFPIQNHPDFVESFHDAISSEKTCWNHKDKVAEKLCVRCQRCYCSDCLPPPRPGTSALSCRACGGVLQDTDPGWRLRPYWRRLEEVVKFPRGQSAMTATAGLAVVIWVASSSLILVPLGISALIFLVYVLAGSAKGRETLQETLQAKPSGGDVKQVIEGSVVTLALIVAVSLPLVAVNVFLPLSIASILTFLLGLAAFVFHPMAIAIAVLSEKPLYAFRPDVMIRQINSMGDDYPALLIGLLIVYAAVFITQFFLGLIPLLGGLIAAVVVAYGALLAAHVLGWTYYLNFGRLGWRRTLLT
jgi:hypothetical protein